MYVAIADDGTPRHGYAQYCCQIMAEHHATVRMVKVVEYGTMNTAAADNAYGRILGESQCQ